MIKTSYYANKAIATSGYLPVGISIGGCRFKIPYTLSARIRELMPTSAVREAPTLGQAKTLYYDHLDAIGPDQIRAKLPSGDIVLLCFERPGQPCHRHWFASWWHSKTGEPVTEL